MARIRYSKTQDVTILHSKQVYHHPNNGGSYLVRLNTLEKMWQVLDHVSYRVAATGKSTSVHKMKIAARVALENLGVWLETDERVVKVKSAV